MIQTSFKLQSVMLIFFTVQPVMLPYCTNTTSGKNLDFHSHPKYNKLLFPFQCTLIRCSDSTAPKEWQRCRLQLESCTVCIYKLMFGIDRPFCPHLLWCVTAACRLCCVTLYNSQAFGCLPTPQLHPATKSRSRCWSGAASKLPLHLSDHWPASVTWPAATTTSVACDRILFQRTKRVFRRSAAIAKSMSSVLLDMLSRLSQFRSPPPRSRWWCVMRLRITTSTSSLRCSWTPSCSARCSSSNNIAPMLFVRRLFLQVLWNVMPLMLHSPVSMGAGYCIIVRFFLCFCSACP